jgi:hypothetical protein
VRIFLIPMTVTETGSFMNASTDLVLDTKQVDAVLE